jgi:hypothetical protein
MAKTDRQMEAQAAQAAQAAAAAAAPVDPYAGSAAALGLSTTDLSSKAGIQDVVIGGQWGVGTTNINMPATSVTDPLTGETTTTTYINNGFGGVTPQVTKSGGTLPTTGLSADMNALQQLQSLYSGMGLGPEIATALTNLIKEGYTPDTLKLMAQDPNAVNSPDPYVKQFVSAYNTRFSANADRIKNGFSPLSPSEYIGKENLYRSAMASAGLPPEFYNTNSALSGWLANNVSDATVQAKINIASEVVNNYDQTAKDQALALYGLDTGHLIAHVLDPVAALPIIQKQANIVQLGAEAARAGVAQNINTLTQLNTIGTTPSGAQQAFGNIAAELPGMQSIASRYSGYGPAGTIEQSLLNQQLGTSSPGETQAQAEARIKRLQTQEASTFGGSSGASQQGQSLGVANQQGVQ